MQLRTRIAVTFLLLLAGVLAAALGVVSAANHGNAAREVQHQLDVGTLVFVRALETNRRQLTQAAEAVAADYGFREAVATRDTDTLASALENTAERVGAAMVVLTTLDGRTMAAYGAAAPQGERFAAAAKMLRRPSGTQASSPQTSAPQSAGAPRDAAPVTAPDTTVIASGGHVYQLVAVSVRSPLPVAWIFMGFDLDAKAVRELADITGLDVTLSVDAGGRLTDAVTTAGHSDIRAEDLATRRIVLSEDPQSRIVATLSRSLAAALAPFERLTRVLFLIAAASLIASAVATFWLARNITRPLRSLTAAVDQIRAGSYDSPVAVERRDELGVLAEGLQVMQAAVRSRDRSISRLAYEDTLTGLMNRTSFGAALSRALAHEHGAVAVAIIDLRRFRRINEHLGYMVGDAVLIEIAARLTAAPAPAASVGRLAADEFAAFACIDDRAALQSWGAALLARLADPVVVESQPIDISATVGLSTAPQDASETDELLRCAELAMGRARRDKRALSVYEPSLRPAARDQLSLLGELHRAIEQNELQIYFQPKIELATGRVAGAEALLRWQHPSRGLIGPGAFIPFAEQTGFIRQLTRWTLDQAAAQAAAWHRRGAAVPLAVNVSADDLGDAQFDQRVAQALSRSGIPPGLLTLEVTESGFIEDPARALKMLEALAALGLKLSIDDFGTGYSSLSHLARMPVNEVKIDRSFVQGLESDAEFAAVVRSAIDMGHSLGLQVVAEGIETEAAAARLRSLNCDIGQGYLYAKPLPRAEFETWVADRARVQRAASRAEDGDGLSHGLRTA